jgi:hypothetical protein
MSDVRPPAIIPAAVSPPGPEPSTRNRAAGWAKLGTGLGIIAAEAAEEALHPGLAEALAIADLAIPAVTLLIVFAVIIRGSQQTCERVFRLLRWITNRPEPAAPEPAASAAASPSQATPGSHVSS